MSKCQIEEVPSMRIDHDETKDDVCDGLKF